MNQSQLTCSVGAHALTSRQRARCFQASAKNHCRRRPAENAGHRLARQPGKALTPQARDHVGRGAGREGHDQLDRARGVARLGAQRGHGRTLVAEGAQEVGREVAPLGLPGGAGRAQRVAGHGFARRAGGFGAYSRLWHLRSANAKFATNL